VNMLSIAQRVRNYEAPCPIITMFQNDKGFNRISINIKFLCLVYS
jgi:hypothetical protein